MYWNSRFLVKHKENPDENGGVGNKATGKTRERLIRGQGGWGKRKEDRLSAADGILLCLLWFAIWLPRNCLK